MLHCIECGLCPSFSEDDLPADAELEAEELDRDIETLEVRLSLAENGIEEASAVLGLRSAATAPGEPEPPKAVKCTYSLTRHPRTAVDTLNVHRAACLPRPLPWPTPPRPPCVPPPHTALSGRIPSALHAPRHAVGTMARLDGLIRELTQEESRRLFRTYLLEFAELSSQVHSLKSGRVQAESERDDLRGELTRVKKTVEVHARPTLHAYICMHNVHA